MFYEMRTYEALPGKLRSIVDRFGNVTHGFFLKYGFRPIGYWPESVGDNTKLHYMLAGEDDAERQAKWAEFRADPERIKAFSESEKDGPMVARIHNWIWEPTAFSPLP